MELEVRQGGVCKWAFGPRTLYDHTSLLDEMLSTYGSCVPFSPFGDRGVILILEYGCFKSEW